MTTVAWIGMALAVLATGAGAAGLAQPGSATVATERIVVRDGAFVGEESGERFTPVGANYFRVAEMAPGKMEHAALCPGPYVAEFVERMMEGLAARGFNTVRTFHAYHVGEAGIVASPEAREINPGYLANTIAFLERARAHGLRVIFSWDVWQPGSSWLTEESLPNEDRCDLQPAWDHAQGINGFRLCRDSLRNRANAIRGLIRGIAAHDASLLATVLSWELENEACLSTKAEPFATRQGTFSFGGRSYAMDSDAEVQELMDAVMAQWANCLADAIHEADPKALAGASVFTFAAVGRGGPGTLSQDQTGDERVPARPLALLGSRVDYVDLHLYAWRSEAEGVTQNLERDLASVEWAVLQTAAKAAGKPILCGECGVFADYLRKAPNWQDINHELGLECFRDLVEGIVSHGLAGALYWHWGNPDSTANDECPALTFHPGYGDVLREVWEPK